VSETK